MKKLALAGLLAVGLTGCSGSEEPKVLNLYNWSEYMPQEVLDRFTEETGIQVSTPPTTATKPCMPG